MYDEEEGTITEPFDEPDEPTREDWEAFQSLDYPDSDIAPGYRLFTAPA